MTLSSSLHRQILQFQRAEINASLLYQKIAHRQKDSHNKQILHKISKLEKNHYEIWKKYTGIDVAPNKLKVFFYQIMSLILGNTFTIKFLEQKEIMSLKDLQKMQKNIPEATVILKDEQDRQQKLIAMINEEKLHYLGSIVLGLNDALVELTGAIAGFTFALENTRLIALSGIITGVSATLSMAASNYLAQRTENNPQAFKASLYTGFAYLITVTLMILPYLLLPNNQYLLAFAIMLSIVILIILAFNYYVSVTQSIPFGKRFAQMAIISLGVAVISFVIGLLAKWVLGVEV